jgi:hypothetical protein
MREIKRNGGRETYTAEAAQLRALKLKVNLERRIRKIKREKGWVKKT